MKISIYGLFPPMIGGVSTHVYRLYKNLLDDNLLNKVYINNIGFINNKIDCDFCIDISLKKRYDIFKRLKNSLLINKDESDIFHIHGSIFWDYILVFILLIGKKNVVFTVHDEMQLNKNRLFLFFLKQMYSNIICKNKVYFIAVNNKIKEQLIKIGIADKIIKVIPAFISDKNNSDLDPEFKLLKKEQRKILFYAPNINSESDIIIYGVEEMFSIFEKLQKSYNNFLLIICVPNKIDSKLLNQILDRYGINNQNIMLFNRPVNNMNKLLHEMDIYIRPTNTDGDSLLLRESIQAGCICLASNVINRPEGTIIYKKNDANDMYDKLDYILKNIEFLKNKNLKNTHDFYSEILDVYRSAINK